MKRALRHFSGDGLKARALRGTGLSALSLVGHNLMRLGSNLVLTRILVPEAFGMLALIYMITAALELFSDIGILPAVIQHKRGDEQRFLNTAWVLQVLRSIGLFAITAALGPVMASFYDAPALAYLLPFVGLEAILMGLRSTKILTEKRHLRLGRLVAIELTCRVVGIAVSIPMSLWLQSVWGPLLGSFAGYTAHLILSHVAIPGPNNRFQFERQAARDILQFGKFIFLSTLAGFFLSHGDKAILGKLVSQAALGLYSIGMLFGTLPLMLMDSLIHQVLMPIYREKPPSGGAENRAHLRRMRRMLFSAVLLCTLCFAYGGVALVHLLYPDTYSLAGPVVSLFALSLIPRLVGMDYNSALLSAGDSRSLFVVQMLTAVLYTTGIFLGFQYAGLVGAILAQGVASVVAYPVRAYLVNRHQAWDWSTDALGFALSLVLALGAVWLNWDSYQLLLTGPLP